MDLDFLGEVNPISLAAGLVGGVIVFAMMGYAGVGVGLIYKIFGFLAGAVAGFLIFNVIINR